MPPQNPRVAQVKAVSSPASYNTQPHLQLGKLQLHQNIINMHSNQVSTSPSVTNGSIQLYSFDSTCTCMLKQQFSEF